MRLLRHWLFALGAAILMKTLVFTAALLLGGCGQIYFAPDVSDQLTDQDVTIVALTARTAQAANTSTYRPRSLPAVFFQNAGTGAGLVSAGALPDPVSLPQSRPAGIQTRLPAEAPQQPYEIGIGDVLVLATPQSATSIEELSGLITAQNQRQGYTVQDDGAVAIPDVGRVQLAGLNLEEAEAKIFQALAARQLDPTFSIEVAEFNSKRASIAGAVRNPQIIPIMLTPTTLQEAIAAAGGATALDQQFTAVRIYRDGTLYQVPLEDVASTNVTLMAGDNIFLDTGFQLDRAQAYFAEQITLTQLRQSARTQALTQLQSEVALRRAALSEARTNFQSRLAADAVDRDFVYLTGEVTSQGRFPLPFGRQATLADALFAQGGPIPETGNPTEIYLLRGHRGDRVTAYHLDGSNPINMLNATKIELRPNDIVFVSQQPVTRWNRVVQQIVPSLILAGASAVAN